MSNKTASELCEPEKCNGNFRAIERYAVKQAKRHYVCSHWPTLT